MNEPTLLWLFGILGVWALAHTAAIWWMKTQVKKIRLAVELFVSDMGKAAALVLHSPTDHLGIDTLLDKYIQNHHDLPYEDWKQLKERCEQIERDHTLDSNPRLAASFVKLSLEFSKHKLSNVSYLEFKP